MSSLPEKLMMARPSLTGSRKLSCFSDVMPESGWNQCVKCVAPFSMAHSFMAWATTLATSISSGSPCFMVLSRLLYVAEGRRSCIVCSLNTIEPYVSETRAIGL